MTPHEPAGPGVNHSFYLESLGCAKNQVDSEVMISSLLDAGWESCEDPAAASVIIVNTCGFIQPAKEESIQVSLDFRKEFPNAKIVMAGCLSQRYGEAIASDMPEVSGVFGNRAPERITEFLDRVLAHDGEVFLPADSVTPPPRRRLPSLPGSTYVKIAEGCNNRCAFCAIPLIRGNLRSRPMEGVVAEIEDLLARGIREINLVAHDLNSFGRDRHSVGEHVRTELPSLLERISKMDGDFWVRLLYLYPETFPFEILPLLESDHRFLPYFDLPMQHAAAGVLEAMGRTGRRESYLELIARIRDALPDSVIRSTFLVGYPGETKEDFGALLRFQEEAAFDWLGVFPYSAEEGTRGYRHQRTRGRVPKKTALARKAEIERRQQPITAARLDRHVGRNMSVLVEENVQGEALSIARAYLQAPDVDGLVVVRGPIVQPGNFQNVRIVRVNGVDLEAVPVFTSP